jgi:DNA-directed RNA polymerase specialized sigma24 family protein
MGGSQKEASVTEDLTLRAWSDDETVLADLVLQCAGAIETSVAKLPGVKNIAEDVVCEAIARFWKFRHRYDGKRPLKAYLYRIAVNVAKEFVTGRLNWQKSRCMEAATEDGLIEQVPEKTNGTIATEQTETQTTRRDEALRSAMIKLTPVRKDIIEAYAFAGDHRVDAGQLGIELGRRHNNGVPYPAVTVRQHKLRAKEVIVLEMRKSGFDLSSART